MVTRVAGRPRAADWFTHRLRKTTLSRTDCREKSLDLVVQTYRLHTYTIRFTENKWSRKHGPLLFSLTDCKI